MNIKSGYKTTEFWLALLGTIVPVVMNIFGLNPPSEATLVGLAGIIVYIISRGWIKSKQ